MLKKYKISNLLNFWECEVEINEEFIIQHLCEPDKPYTALMGMEEMVKFWAGWEFRLQMADGNVTKLFLEQLGREIFLICSAKNLTLHGVMSEFEDREGWFTMDGRFGIKIVSVDDLDFPYDDFEVEEVTG